MCLQSLSLTLVTLVVVFGMRWLEKRVAVPGLISAGGAPMPGH